MTTIMETLVCDANILIDYYDISKRILRLATSHCFHIYVPVPVFDEVDQLSLEDAESLGITVIEPTLTQLYEAANDQSALSDQDCLCLIIAREKNWTCATNEKALYNRCKRESIKVIRGLKIMLELHRTGNLTRQEAMNTAIDIKKENPRLNQSVINDFDRLLTEQESRL